jgi:hypothetical protein
LGVRHQIVGDNAIAGLLPSVAQRLAMARPCIMHLATSWLFFQKITEKSGGLNIEAA